MPVLDGTSGAIKSFAEQQQSNSVRDAELARLNEQQGFTSPEDVSVPPFVPGRDQAPDAPPPEPAPTSAADVGKAPEPTPEVAPDKPASDTETPAESSPGDESDAVAQERLGIGGDSAQATKALANAGATAINASLAVGKHPQEFGSGAYHVIQNIGNAALDATEAVSGWISNSGIDVGQFKAAQHRFTFADAMLAPPQTADEKMAFGAGKMVTEFAGFIGGGEAAGMVGGGKLAAIAARNVAGFAMNFAAFDPHQKKLSDFLETQPALRNVFIDYLASKPDDSNAMGRFKNGLEGVITDNALAGALAAMGGAYKAYGAFKAGAEDAGSLSAAAFRKMSPAEAQTAAEAGTLAKGSEFQAGSMPPRTPAEIAVGQAAADTKAGAQDLPDVKAQAEQTASSVPPGGAQEPPNPAYTTMNPDQVLQARTPEELQSVNGQTLKPFAANTDVQTTIKNLIEHNNELVTTTARGVVPDVQLLESAKLIAAEDSERILGIPVGRDMTGEEIGATAILLNHTADELHAAALNLKETGTPEALAEFQAVQARATEIAVHWSATGTEQGRAFRARQLAAGEMPERLKIAQQLASKSNLTTAQRNAAMVVQILSDPNIDKVRWLGRFAGKSLGEKLGDVATETWANFMLSRPTTVAKIVAAGAAATLMRPLEKLMAYGVGNARNGAAALGIGKPMTEMVSGSEVGQQMVGLFEGAKDGFQMLNNTRKGTYIPGRLPGSPSISLAGENALSGRLWNEDNFVGKGLSFMSHAVGIDPQTSAAAARGVLNVAGKITNLPGKALMTAHDFVRVVNYRMELQALAARTASQEGLTGEAFAMRMQNVLENPPDALKIAADTNAREAAFASPLTGFNAKAEQFIRAFPGGGKIIAPFMRVNANMVTYSLNRNPLFAALSSTAGAQWLGIGKELQAELAAGGYRQNIQEGKIAAGGLLMALAGGLALNGHLTGSGPADPKANKLLRDGTNWQPNSFVLHGEGGSTYHPYAAIEGIGPLLKMATDCVQLFPYMRDEKQKDSYIAAAVALGIRATTPDFISRNLSDFLEAIHSPDTKGKEFVAQLGRTMVPGILSQGNKAFGDNAKRVTKPDPGAAHPIWEEFINMAKSQIPGLSSTLPLQRGYFGEEIYYPDGHGPETHSPFAFINPFKSSIGMNDPVTNEILRLGSGDAYVKQGPEEGQSDLRLDKPNHTVRKRVQMGLNKKTDSVDVPINLTNEQYSKYEQLAAGIGLKSGWVDDDGQPIPLNQRAKTMPTLHEYMAEAVKMFEKNDVPDQRRRGILKDIDTGYKKMAKAQLFAEEPSMFQTLRDAQAAGMRAMQQGPGPGVTGTLKGVSQ